MTFSLGIEIGGTKLQAGVGTPDGKLLSLARAIVDPTRGAQGIRQQLLPLVDAVLHSAGYDWSQIRQIGIGFGGPLNSRRGITLRSFQIQGWDNFPLQLWAEENWQRPVLIQNDASTAALAEATLGAGKGLRRVFYMTIGSGIGGGWVADGKIDDGQGLGAGEVGHMWVPHPETGKPEELELICSGWSISNRAREVARVKATLMTSLVPSIDRIEANTVYTAAEQNDVVATQVIDQTCQTLALAINNIVVMLHPERIVIGGGVSLMGPLFWNKLRHAVQARAFAPFAEGFSVVPAQLGDQVVVIGALLLR